MADDRTVQADRRASATDDRTVTLPADVLGTLIGAGEGVIAHHMLHAEEGCPVPSLVVDLMGALDAAKTAMMEAR